MKVVVVSYDPDWPVAFAREWVLLAASLGEVLAQAHHVGSTAVEGLAAKPIIDILLEVTSLSELDQATARLEALGYEAMGEYGIAGRRYFRKGGFYRTHQIHAFERGDAHIIRHLAFRDYLRARPDVAREYGELKRRLAVACNDDIDTYCEGKDAFVKYHEARVLNE